VTFSGGGRALSEEIVKTVRIVNESVLLDLVENANSDPSADDASGSSGGGGAGCFITSGSEGNSADLNLWLTIILSAIILLGSTGRGKMSQKKIGGQIYV
jgi:hypothetical protein